MTTSYSFDAGSTIQNIKKDIENLKKKQEKLYNELIESIEFIIAKKEKQFEWRPIEEAPHKKFILLNGKGPLFPLAGYYNPETEEWRTATDIILKPTHWIPIPPLEI